MRIGIDFDNTIVCYDQVFHQVARERELIPETLPVSKEHIRNYLRRAGKEDAWTEMQGYVYGKRMVDAQPFPGVAEFIRGALEEGTQLFIISHKTRHPYAGPKYDLHSAARSWLDGNGFFDLDGIGFTRDNAFFELTKEAKLRRVGSLGCTHFIDDLPELLADPGFPEGVDRILFDPKNAHASEPVRRIVSWPATKSELCAA